MKINIFHLRSLRTKITVFTLAIFLIGIWSLAFYSSLSLRKDMQRSLGDSQFSTVSLLAGQVNKELNDRLSALEKIAGGIRPAILDNPVALQTLLDQRILVQSLFNGGIIALDSDCTTIADVPLSAGRLGVNYMDRDFILSVFQEGKSKIGRPLIGKKLLAPLLVMAVPIWDSQGKVIGALMGVTNLGLPNFLDKITENRYGKTGGYFLVAPQYRLIVTATDKTRIMEEFPVSGINPTLDRYIQGYEGSAVYVNPLGMEVLGSAKGIPAAGWIMGAILPTEEAFAPIRAMQQHMLLTTIILTLLVGALVWWMLRCLLSPMIITARTLAALSDTDKLPQHLPITSPDEIGQLITGFNHLLKTLAQRDEAQRKSEERFRSLSENSSDYIMRYDQQYRYLYINPAGLKMVGLEASDLIGKTHCESGFPENQCHLWEERIMQVFATAAPTHIEFQFTGADGPVVLDLQLSPEFDDKGNVCTVLGVSRDITERKLAEKKSLDAMKEKEVLLREIHHRVKNNMQVISSLLFLKASRTENEQAKQALIESQQRIIAMAMIHETLYGSQQLAIIDLSAYLKRLVHHLQGVHSNRTNIQIDLELDKVEIDINYAVPCSLILNELITNVYKHAFPNERKGVIRIKLHIVENRDVLLEVCDNGVGLSIELDLVKPASLGLNLIKRLLNKQLRGSLDVVSGAGTTFTLRWPLPESPFLSISGGPPNK